MQLEKMLFDKVKAEKGFTQLPSGVYYSVAKAGKGMSPAPKDTIIINVVCTLPDGTVIDDTNKTKQSYQVIAGEMIPGIQDVFVPYGGRVDFPRYYPCRQGLWRSRYQQYPTKFSCYL